jgi:hypothetical protein
MLKEFHHLRQIEGEHRRRWFSDDYFDLIVWFEEEEPVGFQLCYNIGKDEHAVTWFKDKSYSHAKVDEGEEVFRLYKSSPVLTANGAFDPLAVAEKFKESSKEIDTKIADLVYKIITEHK